MFACPWDFKNITAVEFYFCSTFGQQNVYVPLRTLSWPSDTMSLSASFLSCCLQVLKGPPSKPWTKITSAIRGSLSFKMKDWQVKPNKDLVYSGIIFVYLSFHQPHRYQKKSICYEPIKVNTKSCPISFHANI